MCLIKGKENEPCSHHWCMMAAKKPQWFGTSIAEFYNTHEFVEIDILRSTHGPAHIIPHNPAQLMALKASGSK